jgi:hypothetical protein
MAIDKELRDIETEFRILDNLSKKEYFVESPEMMNSTTRLINGRYVNIEHDYSNSHDTLFITLKGRFYHLGLRVFGGHK